MEDWEDCEIITPEQMQIMFVFPEMSGNNWNKAMVNDEGILEGLFSRVRETNIGGSSELGNVRHKSKDKIASRSETGCIA